MSSKQPKWFHFIKCISCVFGHNTTERNDFFFLSYIIHLNRTLAVGDGEAGLTLYSPLELISLVFSTSSGWHRKVAQPPCGQTEPSAQVKGKAASGRRQGGDYSQRWSWTGSVWICCRPWRPFPGPAAWLGRSRPTARRRGQRASGDGWNRALWLSHTFTCLLRLLWFVC